jgi:hypothetical protein
MDITDLSDPNPVDYEPEDFFGFYDVILAVNQSETGWDRSTQYALLLSIWSYLENNQASEIDPGRIGRVFRLQEFLATPIAIFNNAFLLQGRTEDMGDTLALAIPSYRVKSPWTVLICSW